MYGKVHVKVYCNDLPVTATLWYLLSKQYAIRGVGINYPICTVYLSRARLYPCYTADHL
jgi:hypothetical protein